MTELPDRVRRALAGADAVADAAEGHEVTTVPFDARLRVTAGPTFTVTVRAPTLSAATADHVADVVEDGWLETFQRRLDDADMALEGSAESATARIEGEELVVEGTLEDADARRGVADAKAFAEYVEGTYMEGVVPGYDYEGVVADLREQAHRTDQ